MLFRAIALSLALLLGMTAVIPFMTNSAEAISKNSTKKKKKLRKYSKAWWRWYHKEKRRKRALLARKRALKARQILLARQRTNLNNSIELKKKVNNPVAFQTKETVQTSKPQPSQNKQNDLQFPVNDNNGKSLGTAQLSVVGQSVTETVSGLPKIGGVSTASLRRNVVDKMAKEEGWVVNDYHKIVNGKKVYVVVAQTSVKGVLQSRLFYFTEVDGKIYSLATTSPNESQERIALESEKVIQSLQQGNYIAQNALQK